MVPKFKTYSLIDQFFEDYEVSPLVVEIEFAITKLTNFLQLTEGINLGKEDLHFFASKFQYNNVLIRKGGNQTLFNARVPIEYKKLSAVCIKFFNQKIKPEAIIQYLASYLYVQSQIYVFELDLEDKFIIMSPAKLYYFSIFDFKLGRIDREVPILVQENIETEHITKEYLTRKELSSFTKLLAKKGFTFDSYESNWKIVKIEKNDKGTIIYCSYIDLFQFLNYDTIKQYLTKIMLKLQN